MAKLSAKVPSLGAIRTSPCTSWDTPPSGGRRSRMRSVSETAKTPSLIPSVRSVRYVRPVLSLSSFDEPSPLMKFSRQLPWSENRFRASRVVGASGRVGARLKFGAEHIEFGPNSSLRVAPKDHPMSRRFRSHYLIDRSGGADWVSRKHVRRNGRHHFPERARCCLVRLDGLS